MKILLVHNYYQQSGGEDQSFEAERQMLRDNGHRVISYTRHNDEINSMGKLGVSMGTLWSRKTWREISQLLTQENPAVMHCTNTFPLISPSIYYAAKRKGIPVVQSLRNYRMFCVNSYFYRNNSICESCLNRRMAWPGVLHGCYRGNRAGSAIVATNQFFNRVMGTWHKKVDCFFSPTEFTRQKFIQGGFDGERILVKPNFLDPDPGAGTGAGNYALFVGRLSPEKGLETLLAAWAQLDYRVPLKVIGDGPSRQLVEQASNRGQIQWLGQRDTQGVLRLIREATCLVVPSRWYETFGRVIIEAYACGTPVLVADHGAMRELVIDNVTGRLFQPEDAQDLARKVVKLFDSPQKLAAMRDAARAEFLNRYTVDANYQNLMNIYEHAIINSGSRLKNEDAVETPASAE